MGIIQRVPWTVQPQVGVGIDRSNALAQGLCLGIDAVRGAYLGNNNSKLSVLDALPTRGGVSRRFPGATNTKNIFPQGTTTASITMLQVGLIGTGTAQNTPFTLSHNGTSNTLAIEHSDGVTAGKVRGRVYVGGYQYCGGSVTLPAGSVYTAVLRHTNGVGQALWLNGVKDSVTTSATGATLGNTYYGAYSTSGVEYGLLNLIWNRALSDAEIAALSANPWQLFAPLPRTIWAPVSASGGTTIAGALGTAVASGFTGIVNANRSIVGALGTAVASGFQGTVTTISGATIAGNIGVASASGFTGGVQGSGLAQATRRHAGGYKLRKGYLIKGRRYFLSDDELAVHIAHMLQEVSRGEVKEITAGKPKVISKRTWDAIKPMERLNALSDMLATETIAEDDDEETLLMLI